MTQEEELASLHSHIAAVEERIEGLAEKLESERHILQQLHERMENLEKEIFPESQYAYGRTETRGMAPASAGHAAGRTPSAARQAALPQISSRSVPEANSQQKPSDASTMKPSSYEPGRLNVCAAAYNALPQGSFAAREKRRQFLQAYQVEGFSCVNGEARMANPLLPPQLRSAGGPSVDDYWAVPIAESLYAVMPNPKITYDMEHHTAGAMGDFFISNYETGRTYQRITVGRPALFQKAGQNWRFLPKQEGRLSLS